jgi:membrane protein implicated in regulation of membrane protease activity
MTQIKHPVSFWLMIVILIVSALLMVTWHGWLIILAVSVLFSIVALRFISHREASHAERIRAATEDRAKMS